MQKFFGFFARKHLLATLLVVMIMLVGSLTITSINKDLFPRVKTSSVIVTTAYPGASPEEVEQNVTNKIEAEIKGINGIKKYVSSSAEDISSIAITLDEGLKESKVNEVILNIRDAVSRVTDLPKDVDGRPLVQREDTSLIPVIGVGIGSEDLPYGELKEHARILHKKLKALSNVARVAMVGFRDREVRIILKPEILRKYRMSTTEVINAISSQNIRGTAGTIQSYTSEQNVITLSHFKNPKDVENVIIRSTFDGQIITLKDVAEVKDTFKKPKILVRINGEEVIYFTILKKEKADIVKTVASVKELIKDEQSVLPEGIYIHYADDLSRYVKASFDVVKSNGIMGFVLVLVVLALFLNLRVSFWVALGIPVSLFGAIALLPLFNVSLDVVTMASMILIIGMIVDDAIIISERVYYYWEKGEKPIDAAIKGVNDIFYPVLTTIISTLLAFLPMFLIPGDLGKFIRVIPLTITLALSISLIESIFSLPSHLAHGLVATEKRRKKVKLEKGKSFFLAMQRGYVWLMERALKLRYLLVAGFVVVLVLALLWGSEMTFIQFPNTGVEEFQIYLETPIGTPLNTTRDAVLKIEKLVADLPQDELLDYTTYVGYSVDNKPHLASIRVNLTPFSKRDRIAAEIVEDLREKCDKIDGFTKIVFDMDDAGPSPAKPVSLVLVGKNDMVRTQMADHIEQSLKAIEGVRDISRNDSKGKEEIVVKENKREMLRFGLDPAVLYQSLQIIYDGETATKNQYDEDEVKFKVMYPDSYTRSKETLMNLAIPNSQGNFIPLKNFATLEPHVSQEVFFHHNGERAIIIDGTVKDSIISPEKVSELIYSEYNLNKKYPGMRIIVEGQAKTKEESQKNLFKTFLIALIGIYILMVLLFDSLTLPFLVLIAIPFGISGVLITFGLHSEPLSFMGMLGVIGLTGVVVNDSLVMVDHLKKMINQNPGTPILELIKEGSAERLRAVLLTTITTAAGLIPLAYGIGGSDPMNAPMALALGWGLVFATPLTLILIPCLYAITFDVKKLFQDKSKVSKEESERMDEDELKDIEEQIEAVQPKN